MAPARLQRCPEARAVYPGVGLWCSHQQHLARQWRWLMLRGRRAPGRGPQAVAAAAALLLAAVSGRDCPGPGSNTSELRAFASSMFHHGYDNYMEHAFPYDELDPIHCRGRGVDEDASNININDVLGNFSLTLVDTLDTLALMGNYSEFWRAVKLVQEHVSFDVNSTVQARCPLPGCSAGLHAPCSCKGQRASAPARPRSLCGAPRRPLPRAASFR